MSAALNIEAGLYMEPDGAVFPITNWIDAEGDECAPEDVVTCVAGEGRCWFALTIADFSEEKRNG